LAIEIESRCPDRGVPWRDRDVTICHEVGGAVEDVIAEVLITPASR
jgi:hypothetical protein